MNRLKNYQFILLALLILLGLGVFVYVFTLKPLTEPGVELIIPEVKEAEEETTVSDEMPLFLPEVPFKEIKFVGPRDNILEDTPSIYGFWSFAIPVPGVISRSGQPRIEEFRWLKEKGWKGIVDLRPANDHNEVGDDMDLTGFKDLGFNYLHLSIPDGSPPTEEQASAFLEFATEPQNWPLHVHCRGGIGRAGTILALFRYAVQGWPIEEAIEESRAFRGGVSSSQERWLENWAKENSPRNWGIK